MTEQEAVIIGAMVDVDPAQKNGRAKQEIDLSRYQELVRGLLSFPAMTKSVTIELTNARGHSASAVKKRINDALESFGKTLEVTVGESKTDTQLDLTKVKIVYRNLTPGVLPITKMSVKWNLITEDK